MKCLAVIAILALYLVLLNNLQAPTSTPPLINISTRDYLLFCNTPETVTVAAQWTGQTQPGQTRLVCHLKNSTGHTEPCSVSFPATTVIAGYDTDISPEEAGIQAVLSYLQRPQHANSYRVTLQPGQTFSLVADIVAARAGIVRVTLGDPRQHYIMRNCPVPALPIIMGQARVYRLGQGDPVFGLTWCLPIRDGPIDIRACGGGCWVIVQDEDRERTIHLPASGEAQHVDCSGTSVIIWSVSGSNYPIEISG